MKVIIITLYDLWKTRSMKMILNSIAIRLFDGEFNLMMGFFLIKQSPFNHNLLPKTIYIRKINLHIR